MFSCRRMIYNDIVGVRWSIFVTPPIETRNNCFSNLFPFSCGYQFWKTHGDNTARTARGTSGRTGGMIQLRPLSTVLGVTRVNEKLPLGTRAWYDIIFCVRQRLVKFYGQNPRRNNNALLLRTVAVVLIWEIISTSAQYENTWININSPTNWPTPDDGCKNSYTRITRRASAHEERARRK